MSPWPFSVCPQRGGTGLTSRENKPVFIALEGGEGAGKSTQAQLLLTRLQQEGRHAILVHEPGTTPLGQHLEVWPESHWPGFALREADVL